MSDHLTRNGKHDDSSDALCCCNPDAEANKVLAAPLAKIVSDLLHLYVLPANYGLPYPALGKQRDHEDVAENAGPFIAGKLLDAGYGLRPATDDAEARREAWDECYASVLDRLIKSVDHGTERGEPWVPWAVGLVRTLRDEQPIPNPHAGRA